MSLADLPGSTLTFEQVAGFAPQINVRVPPQAPMKNWCWACVGAAVKTARGDPKQPCEIARLIYKTEKCCPQSEADPVTDKVQELMGILPNDIGPRAVWGLAQFPRIGTEINAGRPVVVQYKIADGSYHYALIIGMVGTGLGATFALSDPFWGSQAKNFHAMRAPAAQNLFWVRR